MMYNSQSHDHTDDGRSIYGLVNNKRLCIYIYIISPAIWTDPLANKLAATWRKNARERMVEKLKKRSCLQFQFLARTYVHGLYKSLGILGRK